MYGLGLDTRSIRYNVDRLDLGVHLETLRGHHLECLAALDFTDQTFDDRVVLLHRALGTVDRLGPGERRDGRGRC